MYVELFLLVNETHKTSKLLIKEPDVFDNFKKLINPNNIQYSALDIGIYVLKNYDVDISVLELNLIVRSIGIKLGIIRKNEELLEIKTPFIGYVTLYNQFKSFYAKSLHVWDDYHKDYTYKTFKEYEFIKYKPFIDIIVEEYKDFTYYSYRNYIKCLTK